MRVYLPCVIRFDDFDFDLFFSRFVLCGVYNFFSSSVFYISVYACVCVCVALAFVAVVGVVVAVVGVVLLVLLCARCAPRIRLVREIILVRFGTLRCFLVDAIDFSIEINGGTKRRHTADHIGFSFCCCVQYFFFSNSFYRILRARQTVVGFHRVVCFVCVRIVV